MKKKSRGLIAIVCIMALLISSFATYTAITEKEVKADSKYADLVYSSTQAIPTSDNQNAVPMAWALCEEESTPAMYAYANNNWTINTYTPHYANLSWSDLSPYASPDSVTVNGIDYTSATGPIQEFVATTIHVDSTHSDGFKTGYNTVKITKGSEYVTVVFRAGAVVAPTQVEAHEQAGVPGSIIVNWQPGSAVPQDEVYRVYVDGDLKKGNLTGTSAVVNNIDAGTHTVKVVGFYLNLESDGPTCDVSVSTGVKYSPDISIEGFQIRSNYPDGTPEATKEDVAFRTMCKAPKINGTVKVGGKTYTVRQVGTIYAKDTNTRDKQGTNVLDASYTLLNETPINNNNIQYSYTGYRTYQGNNRTFGYVAGNDAIISDYKAGDTDNVYYAFTMQGMNQEIDNALANTLWVRPFVVADGGTIIYGKTTAYTSVAEIADKLYATSMCKNVTSHNYLFTYILNNDLIGPQYADSPFYRDPSKKIEYGWNGNLYIGFRKVPDSWNQGTGKDEGTYVPVGDWKIHNSSHYDESTPGKQAAASYKGNSNEEMMVRVDNPGAEAPTDQYFMWNWGIQMKLPNTSAYSRLEDGKKYRMTITYNTTKAGIMRIKPEGNNAAGSEYMQPGHELVYDFDAVAGGNSHSIEFTYNKSQYVKNPGADPSIVLCPGRFNVYPFGSATASTNNCRARLHIKYLGQYKDTESTVTDAGGFPAGTIISDVDVTFTQIDAYTDPETPNILH